MDLLGESNPEPSGGEPHRCEGDKCSFVRTESPLNGDSLDASDFLAVFDLPATSVEAIADRTIRETSFKVGADFSALRRHLILAVLLV